MKLKGLIEQRNFATRFWNNDDKFSSMTIWENDIGKAYEIYKNYSREYENSEFVEEIIHVLSARGTEACIHDEPLCVYDKQYRK